MSYLLDTDAVIDDLTAQPSAMAIRSLLIAGGIAVSAVTEIELWEGVFNSRDRQRSETQFRLFLLSARVLLVTRQVGQHTARIRADLRLRRQPINHRALDLIVAGTALAHNLTLVTSNTRHYGDIPDLKLLNPRRAI